MQRLSRFVQRKILKSTNRNVSAVERPARAIGVNILKDCLLATGLIKYLSCSVVTDACMNSLWLRASSHDLWAMWYLLHTVLTAADIF